MAVILSQITIGDTRLIITDVAPHMNGGLTAEIGSMVIVAGQGGIYLKVGSGDADWKLSTVDATQLGLDLADLDGRLDVLELDPVTKSYVDAAILDLQGQIDSEESRAMSAENVLQGNLDSEVSRAQAAEGVLTSDLSSEVSTRQSEISRVEGLVSSEASSRQSADADLDSRLDIIEGVGTGSIAKALQDAKDYSDVEKSRAMAAEAGLSSSVSSEQSRAMAAEGILSSDLSSEVSRAQGAEQDLQSNIDSEESRAMGIESGLRSDLTSEVSRAQGAESALSGRLDVLEADPVTKTYVDGEVSGLQGQINNIVSNVDPAALDSLTEIVAAFQAADSSLNGAVSALGSASTSALGQEITRAQNAEQTLQDNIDAEESSRISGDQTLQSNINAEQSRAMAAEGVLQANIDSEETRAMGVEADLQSQITSEVSRAQGVESSLSSSISAEESRAMAAESSLSSDISSETSRAMAAEGVLAADLASEVSARELAITNLQNTITNDIGVAISNEVSRATAADNALDARLDILETDPTTKTYVDAEKTRAMGVESSLQSQISQEVSDRQSDVSDLQGQINSEITNRQSAVSGEQSARQSADNVLQSNIDAEEASRISDVAALQSLISSEEASRIANDADNLVEAKDYADSQDAIKLNDSKAYTDQKIADLINGAPGTLDTLKEIADQLANDESAVSALVNTVASNLQTAKDYADAAVLVEKNRAESEESDLQGQISQEVSDRQSAISSEQSRAQAAEALKLNKAGDTMSGDLNMGGNDVVNVGAIGVGTSTPESIFEIKDNNVRYNIKGSSTSTTGSMNAIVSTVSPAVGSVELVKIMVTGIESSTGDSVVYEKTVKVKNVGGTVSLGVIQSDYTSEDHGMASANCTFVVNASDVDVRVTGVNSKTITWKCVVERMR